MTQFASLEGKTALITGGGRGIGKAIARTFKEAGAQVVISGSNEAVLKRAAEELGCKYITANLAQAEDIAHLVSQSAGVDILVNNAGITRDALFARQSEEQWHEVLNINLNAAVQLTRGILPHMSQRQFGRIINISSIVAHMGNIGQTNYITAKAAITGFTKGLAKEVARKGVTVNCVAPGFIETDMTADIPQKVIDKFMEQIPAQRFGQPADIAAAVRFLASAEAAYITGTTVHINGGLYV